VQVPGHIDQAKEQHIKELESLVSEYRAHIRALKTEVQELAKRPMLDQGLGLQVLREELTNEKHAVQEARRGTSRRLHHEKVIHSPPSLLPFALEEKEDATQKDGDKIEELRQTLIEPGSRIGAGRHVPPGVRVLSLRANPA
jgi:mitotic spindle assembly checkpoint protein MAD1